jgi:pimeloyl-ACP methyl ester carboxylesterase
MDESRLTPREKLRAITITGWGAARLAAQALVPPLCPAPLGDSLSDPQRLQHGLILLLPGIGGESFMIQDLARALDQAGVPDAIEVFPWATSWIPLVGNLMTYRENLKQAGRLADRIRLYRSQYPQRPIHLIGYSGGAAEAVLALERLQAPDQVDAAILLAGAISPTYNLVPALHRTRFGIYNFRNPNDRILLGLGMLIFGTLDRRHVLAAGMVGFRPPQGTSPSDADIYRTKLHEWPWVRRMLRDGHPGGHVGWTEPSFVREWVYRILATHRLGKPAEF